MQVRMYRDMIDSHGDVVFEAGKILSTIGNSDHKPYLVEDKDYMVINVTNHAREYDDGSCSRDA